MCSSLILAGSLESKFINTPLGYAQTFPKKVKNIYEHFSRLAESGFLGVVLVKFACVRPFSILKSEKSIFTISE